MAPLPSSTPLRTILSRAAITLSVLIILGYGFSRTYDAFAGPGIDLITPPQGATTSIAVVVAGKSKRVFELRINGNIVPTTPEGKFQEVVGLSVGYNILTVTGLDRLGKSVTITREIIRE